MQNCRRKAPHKTVSTDRWTAMAIPVYPLPLRGGGGVYKKKRIAGELHFPTMFFRSHLTHDA